MVTTSVTPELELEDRKEEFKKLKPGDLCSTRACPKTDKTGNYVSPRKRFFILITQINAKLWEVFEIDDESINNLVFQKQHGISLTRIHFNEMRLLTILRSMEQKSSK